MKNRILIIEGAQGVGKTTITRLLREQMPYSSLFSLAGTSDKSKNGESKIYKQHQSILNVMDNCKGCGLNFILDRSFLSERVYCNLGFKYYDFKFSCDNLMNHLNHIADSYDVHIIQLVATEEELAKRLNRDKPAFLDVHFNAINSIKQQEGYRNLIKHMKKDYANISYMEIDVTNKDPYDIAYDIKEGTL